MTEVPTPAMYEERIRLLEAEVKRVGELLADTETEKIERGTEIQRLRDALEGITPAALLLIRLDNEWFDPYPVSQDEVSAATDRASKALAAVREENE